MAVNLLGLHVLGSLLVGNLRIVACMHFDASDTYLALTMSRMDSTNNRILLLYWLICQVKIHLLRNFIRVDESIAWTDIII